MNKEKLDREFDYRRNLFLRLYKDNIIDFRQVQKVIHEYYKSPESVLKKFNLL